MKLTVKNRKTSLYVTGDGKKPFDEWLWRLKDLKAKARIIHRLDRAAIGNFGKYRDLRSGVLELKEDFGPGYRIYFGLDGDDLIILLIGGDKGSQDRDILKAKEYWTDYLWRKKS
jgi:putative addiction module killer protein